MASKPSIATDPLASWNQGPTKDAILQYIQEVTNESSAHFIPISERIATFDNDGTLWSEQPIYTQLFFTIDRLKSMVDKHPEWKHEQPYQAALEGDTPTLIKQGKKGLLKILAETHAGMSTDAFDAIVTDWIASAQHPEKKRLFRDLIYQPMRELLAYLAAQDFKIFIVSGGGVEFMRAWVEAVYGVPKNQVIGSDIKTQYKYNDGAPVLERLAKLDFFDQDDGKPVAIHRFIGRKPVFAAGNSDGDLQMLRWADANAYQSFKLFVHHTDAQREWAYDRESRIGTLDKGLDEARAKGWVLADMKKDWREIYPTR